MAIVVTYDHEFLYRYDDRGRMSPIVQVQIRNLTDPARAVEVDAYLDSGVERSLFDGRIAEAVGLDVMSGAPQIYQPTSGAGVAARLHRVLVSHPDLGPFQLIVGFSVGEIRRNLLGRDLFDFIQIGFREHHTVFYVTPTP